MSESTKRKRLIAGTIAVVLLCLGFFLTQRVGPYAVFCSPILFFGLAWAFLACIDFPRAPWAALRASLPTVLFLSQLPYLGFVLLPFEIAASGALIGNRKTLALWKAIFLMAIARVLVLAALEPWYLKDLLEW